MSEQIIIERLKGMEKANDTAHKSISDKIDVAFEKIKENSKGLCQNTKQIIFWKGGMMMLGLIIGAYGVTTIITFVKATL